MLRADLLAELEVCRNHPASLFEQLAENIRWCIATGKISTCDRLPPMRELARQLNLSVNTVRQAYAMLEDQGLVVSRPRHGTQVVATPGPAQLAGLASASNQCEEWLSRAIGRALFAGYESAEVLKITEKILAGFKGSRGSPIIFVECSDADARHLGKQLAQALGVHVQPIALENLQDYLVASPATPDPIIATTFFHYKQVREITRAVSVFGVVLDVAPEVSGGLAALPAGTRLAVICRDKVSTQYLTNLAHSLRGDLETRSCLLAQVDELRDLLQWSDASFCTPPCQEVVERLAPSGTHIFFYNRINQQSVAMLREQLGIPRELPREEPCPEAET